MTNQRVYALVGWSLAILSVAAVAVAALEAYVVGYPRPLSLVTALLLTGTAISWPFVTGAVPSETTRIACIECHRTAWGFQEFHFCIHCGSTRTPRRVRT